MDIRISISEAARLFGVSTKTIRQAIYNDEIRYITVRGRYKLNFKSVLAWSQHSTRRRNQLTKDGIGQFVTSWNITNTKYSPVVPPELTKNLPAGDLVDEPEDIEPTLELEWQLFFFVLTQDFDSDGLSCFLGR